MENVGNFHCRVDDPVDDPGTPFERDGAQAGCEIIARTAGKRQSWDQPAARVYAFDIAVDDDRARADAQHAGEDVLEVGEGGRAVAQLKSGVSPASDAANKAASRASASASDRAGAGSAIDCWVRARKAAMRSVSSKRWRCQVRTASRNASLVEAYSPSATASRSRRSMAGGRVMEIFSALCMESFEQR